MTAPEEQPDSNAERPRDDDDATDSRQALGDLGEAAEGEASRVLGCRTISLFGSPLPVRAVVAVALFAVVFVLVWLAAWALLGGIGIALGWIPAAILAWLAVRLAVADTGRSVSGG